MTEKKNGTGEIEPWEFTALHVVPAGAPLADADLQKIIRKNYREPMLDEDQVRAEIEGASHRICNIGSRGLGLIVPSLSGFLAGSSYGITLHIGDNTLALRGKVTHISPSEISGECHCGVEFIDLSKEDEQTLHHFLTEHHARLFGGTNDPVDLGRD